MKREFLTEKLGLSKEICEKIMAQYGESVNKLRSENESLIQKISTFEAQNNDLAAYKTQVSELSAENKKLLESLENTQKELSDSKLSGAVATALSAAGAKNLKAAGALIDRSAVTVDEEGVHGLSEQIEKIKGECGYLFYDGNLSSGMRHTAQTASNDGFTQYARAGAKLN